MDTLPAPAIGCLLLITLCYAMRVWLVPFKTCRRCSGMGRIGRKSGRGRPRPCRRCKGHGIRPRLIRKTGRGMRRSWRESR